jgi:hypothetical protein
VIDLAGRPFDIGGTFGGTVPLIRFVLGGLCARFVLTARALTARNIKGLLKDCRISSAVEQRFCKPFPKFLTGVEKAQSLNHIFGLYLWLSPAVGGTFGGTFPAILFREG